MSDAENLDSRNQYEKLILWNAALFLNYYFQFVGNFHLLEVSKLSSHFLKKVYNAASQSRLELWKKKN